MPSKDIGQIKKTVREFVDKRQGVSFVELERLLDDKIEIEGEQSLTSAADPKINYWMGMSDEFAEIIRDMIKNNELYIDTCSPLVYAMDGKQPGLKLAKQPPKDGYKTQRWLPIVFYTEEQ